MRARARGRSEDAARAFSYRRGGAFITQHCGRMHF